MNTKAQPDPNPPARGDTAAEDAASLPKEPAPVETESAHRRGQAVPVQHRPHPGPLPADGDEVHVEGERAARDVDSGRTDTDEAGRERQRAQAPPSAPTRRDSTT